MIEHTQARQARRRDTNPHIRTSEPGKPTPKQRTRGSGGRRRDESLPLEAGLDPGSPSRIVGGVAALDRILTDIYASQAVPLNRLTSRQRDLLETLIQEFERERTEFLVTSGGELSTIGLDGTPITLPAWKRKFVESDLRDLQSEGYIRLDTVLRPGGSLRFHKGSVTPQAREEFHRRKGIAA